jgi:pimeloyl-ACP methyl ester carboxylesterase
MQAHARSRRGNRPYGFPSARGAAALTELAARAWQPAAEFGTLIGDPIYWGWGVARGDGHSVLVLPGLLGGDGYLLPLRSWLRRVGYAPLRSGIDRNPGWSEELVQELGELVEGEYRRSGRPLTIIGHSMGGVLGRSVAVRHPHAVRHVITLGSPLRRTRSVLPEGVRLSAIASEDDRVVGHSGARSRDPGARNIDVRGSHTGMVFNASVYRRLAELLPPGADSPVSGPVEHF